MQRRIIVSKKIIERRKASVNVAEDKRASIANFEAKQKRSAVKGILLTVVIVIAIAALLFLVVNALINNISKNISPAGSYKDIDPVISESFKENNGFYVDKVLNSNVYKEYAFLASNNHSATVNAIKSDENVFNYAIYGIENNSGVAFSDIIVIASINKTTNKLTYVLLDDQTLVYIPYANVIAPLKDAYNFGGANLLSRTISQNFGIDINGYVELKMDGAMALVDAVGGIDIAMNDAELDEFKVAIDLYNEKFKDENTGLVYLQRNEKTGTVTLTGEYALVYIRGKSGSDTEALFTVLVECTKSAINGGVEGIKTLSEALSDRDFATTSTEAEDFSSILMLAVKTTGDVLADSLTTIDMSTSSIKTKLLGEGEYVYFSAYNDYSKAVADLKTALYAE